MKMRALLKYVFVVVAASAASGYILTDRDIVFHLFTRLSPKKSEPLLASVSSIMTSSFSMGRNTIITVHNFGESVAGNFNSFVINAHLAAEDVNLIAVDWSRGCSVYTQGLVNAPICGRTIATFINILVNQFGYNPDRFRIVGVGLGGHIAGIAARRVYTGVPHIFALDPSLHGWTHHPEILTRDDALVVEVLHTSAGDIGFDRPLGDLDFYANGGKRQMGCADPTCSHSLSYVYYAESIKNGSRVSNSFVGTACRDYNQALTLSCNGARDATFGGLQIKLFESGIYSFQTNSWPPYARG